MDLFVGLYQIDAATDSDNACTDNESDADLDVDEPERLWECGLGVQHGDGCHCQPPTIPDAQLALEDLTRFLYPQCQKQKGYRAENKLCNTPLDSITWEQLEDIWSFLWWYCDFNANGKSQNLLAGFWIQTSVDVAGSRTKRSWQVWTLWVLARAYVQTQELLTHNYGKRHPRIEDKELSTDIQEYLQGVGKYTCIQDIVEFTKGNNIQKRYGFTKLISLATVKCWMGQLGYHWTKELKGQYQDGHEHEDMVEYVMTRLAPFSPPPISFLFLFISLCPDMAAAVAGFARTTLS